MTKLLLVLQAGATLLLLSPSTYASFITNSNLAVVDLSNVAVNLNDIDFGYAGTENIGPPATATGPVDATGTGNSTFLITSGNGSFSGLSGTDATIRDLCQGSSPCVTPVTAGSTVSYANFITFSSPTASTWSIELTELLPGSFSTAGCAGAPGTGIAGQTCTPPLANSPFNLTNEGPAGQPATGVDVSFAFTGLIMDGNPADTDPVSGTFSTTFSGTDLQTLVTDIAAGETIVTSAQGNISIQASTVTTPEPSTMMLAGLGGALLALGAIRRRARS